jgi:predicted nucleotidyltransferase
VKAQRQRPPTIDDAKRASELLRRTYKTIDSVLLYGSVARGDANRWSDIDLIVTGADSEVSPEDLRRVLSYRSLYRVSLIYYPTSVFRKHYLERALFIAHLKREGVALFDRYHLLDIVLRKPFVPVVDVSGGIKAHLLRLSPYSDPSRFNNNFLFCLAHIYSIAKGIMMLGLAHHGVLEFNREAAFKKFAVLNPDLKREVQKVKRLRPFYSLVTGRKPERLPFSYKSAGRQLMGAVGAVHLLARRAEVL